MAVQCLSISVYQVWFRTVLGHLRSEYALSLYLSDQLLVKSDVKIQGAIANSENKLVGVGV